MEKETYLKVRSLRLRTLGGLVYDGIDIDANPGSVTALRGRSGSGKTALLLTLSGRMKPSSGTLQVGGYELPRQRSKVERSVGLALFAGLNDLQENLSLDFVMHTEFKLFNRPAGKSFVKDYLQEWGLADIANERVKDITAEQKARFGIALACVGKPKMIVVDDIEDQMTMNQSKALMELLLKISRELDLVVVVGIMERDLAAMADKTVYLSKEGV